jgi:hypothetical protein
MTTEMTLDIASNKIFDLTSYMISNMTSEMTTSNILLPMTLHIKHVIEYENINYINDI